MAADFDARVLEGLTESYSLDELHTLCFNLGVDYEAIPHSTKPGLARELIARMHRERRLRELINELRHEKPYVSWPDPSPGDTHPRQSTVQSPKSARKTNQLRRSRIWFVIGGLFLVVAMGAVAWNLWNSRATTPVTSVAAATVSLTQIPGPRLRIIRPGDGDVVGHEVVVEGQLVEPVCEACDLYVVVHPVEPGEKYYVQTDAALQHSSAAFTAEGVIVGSASLQDNGKSFEIWVVLAHDAPGKLIMTPDEWTGFAKESAAVIAVIRDGL